MSQVSEPPFSYVEQMPVFRGGNAAMYAYVADHIAYPDSALRMGIEGMVIAQYVVDIDSLAKEVKIIRGIGYGCDEAVLKLFDSMNEQKLWIPGMHNHKPVPVIFTLPVTFKLTDTKTKKNKRSKKDPD
jgi:protein TonB